MNISASLYFELYCNVKTISYCTFDFSHKTQVIYILTSILTLSKQPRPDVADKCKASVFLTVWYRSDFIVYASNPRFHPPSMSKQTPLSHKAVKCQRLYCVYLLYLSFLPLFISTLLFWNISPSAVTKTATRHLDGPQRTVNPWWTYTLSIYTAHCCMHEWNWIL